MNEVYNTASVLIIEPAGSGLGYIPAAKGLGLTIYVFSANEDDRIIPDMYKKYIDQLFIVDTNCLRTVKKKLRTLLEKKSLQAIIPGFEYYVDYCLALNDIANLPPPWTEKANQVLRNKLLSRDIINNEGFEVPSFAEIMQASDLYFASQKVNFPAVLKPSRFGGSIHVSKVNNLNELYNAYQAMCEETWKEMGNQVGNQAIIESYISGPEYSVEGFVKNDKVVILSITEKLLSSEPYFVEMGHITPANIGDKTQVMIEQYTKRIITHLGIHYGAFHCEIRMNKEGPQLIEIAGRPPGDHICDLIKLSTGVNFYQQVLNAYLNRPTLLQKPNFKNFAGVCFITNKSGVSGYLKTIQGIDKITKKSSFVTFYRTCNFDEFVPSLNSIRARIGCVFFSDINYKNVHDNIYKTHSVIKLNIEPV